MMNFLLRTQNAARAAAVCCLVLVLLMATIPPAAATVVLRPGLTPNANLVTIVPTGVPTTVMPTVVVQKFPVITLQTAAKIDPCLLQGMTSCGGSCTNTSTDSGNCGSCGHWCPASASCVNGNCAEMPGISGTVMTSNITCKPPADHVTFLGSSFNVPAGTPISFIIFDAKGASPKVLPDSGVLIGSAPVLKDGFWRYNWTGAVPGYTLVYGTQYMVKAQLSDTNFLQLGVWYYCQPGDVPSGLQAAVPAAVAQPLTLVTVKPVQQGDLSGGDAGAGTGAGTGAGAGSSTGSGQQQAGDSVVSPALNPQPEPPAPLQTFWNFISGIFGGGSPKPK